MENQVTFKIIFIWATLFANANNFQHLGIPGRPGPMGEKGESGRPGVPGFKGDIGEKGKATDYNLMVTFIFKLEKSI